MTSQGRVCYFCESHAKLSVEHIYGKKWLADLLPRSWGFANRTIRRDTREGPSQQWQWRRPLGKGGGMEVKSVCRDCNHGWMERLDENTKPLLWPLCFAERGTVTIPDGNLQLARWATKIALVIDSAMKEPVIPQELRTKFMRDREPLVRSTVWIATMAWTRTSLRQAGLVFGPPDAPNEEALYVATFRALHLIFQVVCPISADVEAAHLPGASYFVRRLWPPEGAIDWPPPRSTWIRDEEEFWGLAQSWHAMRTGKSA